MTLSTKFRGMVQIVRPELPLAAGMCVVLGEFLGRGRVPPLPVMAEGALCGFLLSASAMATNDYFDLAVDRVNTPWRPLPAGLLAPREALMLGGGLGILGLLAAWGLSPAAGLLAGIVWALGFLYNWRLKASGLLGNLIVGLSVAMTFVMGGIGVGQPGNGTVWLFGLIALVFDLAEEIAGDAMDMAGDQQRGSQSIALRWGKPTALRVSAGLFGLVVVLSWAPAWWGGWGLGYLIPILLMDVLIGVWVVKLLRSTTPEEGRWAMRALYLSASSGLLAFLMSALLGKG